MAWVETTTGNYVNLDVANYLFVQEEPAGSGTWVIKYTSQVLAGSYASQAAAQEALRKLVQGINPTDFV